MRKIKFRGKSKENNEWIEGYYGYKDLTEEHFIIVPTFDSQGSGERPQYFTDNLVESKTVSEYTTLKDVKGKEIYEHDIVKADGMYASRVIFENGTFKFEGGSSSIVEDFEHYSRFEVIGNIFDKEL